VRRVKSTSKTSSSDPGLEQQKQAFRQYLREADKLILDHQFQEARRALARARELFPGNVYLTAFEERILVFEAQGTTPASQAAELKDIDPVHTTVTHQDSSGGSNVDHHEENIRQEIEEKYKKRYTEELHKMETQARELLNKDRERLEGERVALERLVTERVHASRQEIEHEFQQKVKETVAETQQQLEEQFARRLHAVEEEITARATTRYAEEKKKLEEQFRSEQHNLLDQERRESELRECQLKEDHANALQQVQREQEHLQTRSVQQQEEHAQLKARLEKEFETALNRERSEMEQHYNQMSSKLTDQFQAEHGKLKTEFEGQLREEVEAMRRKEAADLEGRRAEVHRELEAQAREKYERQLEAEKNRIETNSKEFLDEEMKKLQIEFSDMLEMQNANVQQIRMELQQQMEREFVERLDRLAHESENKLELLGARIPESHTERLAFYRTRISPFYQSGLPDADQVRKVMQLKELLELTFDEHLQVESEIRLDLYIHEVQRKVQAGTLPADEPQKLDDLKQKFGVTTEESVQLEPRVIALLQRLTSKRKILVADDEEMLLASIADLLQSHNFHVITANTVSKALEELMKSPVDLILSDIKYGNDELDGFKFFEAVQRVPALCTIPFIFMSSLREGVIVRSGMLMGVDDYLTKPIDPDLLVAVVEGKLRRVRMMAERKST